MPRLLSVLDRVYVFHILNFEVISVNSLGNIMVLVERRVMYETTGDPVYINTRVRNFLQVQPRPHPNHYY